MCKKINETVSDTLSCGNVFADLGLPDADKYLAKAELARQINNIVKGRKQKDIAQVLDIDQPKVSLLSRGLLDDFSIERLIFFLNKLDRDVEIIIKKRPTRRKSHGRLKVAFA